MQEVHAAARALEYVVPAASGDTMGDTHLTRDKSACTTKKEHGV